jgi:hypothetical protein
MAASVRYVARRVKTRASAGVRETVFVDVCGRVAIAL